MKKQAIIKQLFFAGLFIGGMNIFSSCDSCSRKTENTEENTTIDETYESSSADDTISSVDNSGAINDGSTSSAAINASSTSGSGKTGNASRTTKTTTPAGNTSTSASTANNTKKEEARQQAITDMVENSDAKSAVGKDGKPIRSSGDAGTGSGTGTGSTGNNSRVTTREAQKAN